MDFSAEFAIDASSHRRRDVRNSARLAFKLSIYCFVLKLEAMGKVVVLQDQPFLGRLCGKFLFSYPARTRRARTMAQTLKSGSLVHFVPVAILRDGVTGMRSAQDRTPEQERDR